MEQDNANELEFSLITILNILWRRRLIVLGLPALGLMVGLLYGQFGTKRWSATATVRPGITAYTIEGFPLRQWQLKDITTWYDKMFYQKELNERLGLDSSFKTVIQSEFVATGLTNLAGGEVVTLWTTGTSPELAKAFIDTSIALFQNYAEGDSSSSDIELTRSGLALQIKVLETRFSSVDKQEVSLNLDLEQARADSLVVAVMDEELGLEIEKLEKEQDFYRHRIQFYDGEQPILQGQLDQVNELVGRVIQNAGSIDPQDIPSWARREAVLDGGDVLEGLGNIRLQIQESLDKNRAHRDSCQLKFEVGNLEYKRRILVREAKVQAKLREIEKRIGHLELERDFVLPVKRSEVRNDIKSKQVQLGSLTSLQQVGGTVVSDKPVRPRGLRATLILVFLGMIGGLVLGFSYDYIMVNRKAIFRS